MAKFVIEQQLLGDVLTLIGKVEHIPGVNYNVVITIADALRSLRPANDDVIKPTVAYEQSVPVKQPQKRGRKPKLVSVS